MGKRKSKSIETEAPGNVPELAQEFDVAGPLTLEEAKAVGDIPEDFKMNQAPPGAGGILKHPASPEGDNVVPSSGDPEALGERKSVTFAEQPPEEISGEEKPSRRKSLLEFLHLKKKKDVEPMAQTQEETNENVQVEGTEAAAATETETPEEPAEWEDSAKPKKRKSVLSSLFHRKGKDDTSEEKNEEGPEEAVQAVDAAATEAEQVKQAETPGPVAEPQAIETPESPALKQAEVTEGATSAEKAVQDKVPGAEQVTESPPEKKSFFGRLFSKRSSRTSESVDSGAGAGTATVGEAMTPVGVAVVGATADQENSEAIEGEASGTAPSQTSEESTPPAKKKKPFWATTYPEPSPDAVSMKEGGVRKKGYIFQSFRPRFMRIMSDGILQYTRKEGEWEDAKGLKLTHDMEVEAQGNSGKNPYVLKVNVPEGKSCVFGFDSVEDRDDWKCAFEEMRAKLQANIPDDGNQHVMKSGTLEKEGLEDPAHDDKEGTSA